VTQWHGPTRHGLTDRATAPRPRLLLQAFGLTEPTVGSDSTSIETFAENAGDEYVIAGGSHIVGGIGGGGDFMRHATLSILALPSTAAGGDVSRIVRMATSVGHIEHDVDVLITEHGLADLRGTSPRGGRGCSSRRGASRLQGGIAIVP
jgi:alkylation response protein AidB-like acyl-CoA dehydrogenase